MKRSATAAEEALKQGDLKACREALFKHVRGAPEDAGARAFLFQFLCVIGDWDRAKKQLEILAEMDNEAIGFAAIYSAGIDAMATRAEVIAGKQMPPVFGPPEAWIAKLGEALRQDAAGDAAHAASLRQDAYGEAPARPGTVDGKPFEWITDADARFGPCLEAVVDGSYHWLPLQHVAKLELEAPKDLRDLVWLEGALTLTNGGSFGILVPARYPGAEASADAALAMARRTDWEEMGEGMYRGAGQKMLATDAEDLSLLEVRCIEFEAPEVEMNFDAPGADLSADLNLTGDPKPEG